MTIQPRVRLDGSETPFHIISLLPQELIAMTTISNQDGLLRMTGGIGNSRSMANQVAQPYGSQVVTRLKVKGPGWVDRPSPA